MPITVSEALIACERESRNKSNMINILRTKLKSTTADYDKVCKKLTEISHQYDVLQRDYAALREESFVTETQLENSMVYAQRLQE